MKVLVTGATGFIGNYVIKELLKRSNDIVATSKDQHKAAKFEWFRQVQYIPCDLNEMQDNFFQFFQEPDLLIHLAWEGLPNFEKLFHFERTVTANYKFIKNLVQCGLRQVAVTGTCLEYGLQECCLKEEMDTRPVVAYGLAKDTLRKYLEQLFKKYTVTFQWLRLFYMSGDGQSDKSLLPQLEAAIKKGDRIFNMSGGEQLRDYLPVEKVAEYIVTAALQKKVHGVINICSSQPISVRRFVENFLNEKGYKIQLNLGYYPYPNDEPMSFWGDNSKLKGLLI